MKAYPFRPTALTGLLLAACLSLPPAARAANLLSAAQQGDLDTVISLHKNGVSLNQQDPNGNTALMFALRNQHPELAHWLLAHGADPSLKRTGADEMQHWRALDFAIVNGYPTLALELIKAGAEVSYQDRDGDSPLHHAVKAGQRQVVEALLAAGAPINAQRGLETSDLEPGWTPLMYAIDSENYELALYLLQQGADPYLVSGATSDSIERGQEDAFMQLSWFENGQDFGLRMLQTQIEVIAKLPPEQAARKANLVDNTLYYALRYQQAEAVEALLAQGANLNGEYPALMVATGKDASLAFLKQLVAWGAKPNQAAGALPLHLAILAERADLVNFYLSFGPDINARYQSQFERTPLQLAACGPPDILSALLARKAQLDSGDNSAYSALMIAAECNHRENAAGLLRAGASWRVKGSDDKTALRLAIEKSDPALVQLLLQAGARASSPQERDELLQTVQSRLSESEPDIRQWQSIAQTLSSP